MVVDFPRGGPLRRHMTDVCFFSENDIGIYLVELSSALEYLHNKGILHRWDDSLPVLWREEGRGAGEERRERYTLDNKQWREVYL